MSISIHRLGAAKPIVGMHVRRSGATKLVHRAWLRKDGKINKLLGTLALNLSSSAITGRANSGGPVTVFSRSVTATPDGTVGTVTYLWTRTDSNPQSWTIESPNAATTRFSTICDESESFGATFKCTATDAAAQVIASTDVSVSCANAYYGGGYNPGGGGHVYP